MTDRRIPLKEAESALARSFGAPRWLRPVALTFVAAVHAIALLAVMSFTTRAPQALSTVNVDVIAEGDNSPETTKPSSVPETPPQDVEQPKAEENALQPTPAEAKAVPESPQPENSQLLPETDKPGQEAVAPASHDEAKPRPVKETAPAQKPKAASVRHAKAGEGPVSRMPSDARRVGTAEGRSQNTGMSTASYAALVLAQIQANKFYPQGAKSRGVSGSVGVSFSIGPSGNVRSVSVIRSSGSSELDGAARQIVRSVSPPPPPNGSFAASTTLQFTSQ